MINFAKSGQISRIRCRAFGVLCMMSMLTGGCFTTEDTRYPEPTTIAVRNNSGISLSVVTLKALRNSGERPVRMGSVSPVPIGATQVFVRPSSPPPLPEWVIVGWKDYDQGQYERELSLEDILSDPNTQTKASLIFEIQPFGRIDVFKE